MFFLLERKFKYLGSLVFDYNWRYETFLGNFETLCRVINEIIIDKELLLGLG